MEFSGAYASALVEEAEPEFRSYFQRLGVADGYLPRVKIGERYPGSLIIEAAVVIAASAGAIYRALKAVSELPEIADGLSDLKGRIAAKLKPRVEESVREQLDRVTRSDSISTPATPARRPIPPRAAATDLVIDARPLKSLTPAVLKAHAVHLSCAVSRDAVSIENLGDEPLTNLNIGLFPSATESHQWNFGDAYSCTVPSLGGHQTLVKPLADFKKSGSSPLAVDSRDVRHSGSSGRIGFTTTQASQRGNPSDNSS